MDQETTKDFEPNYSAYSFDELFDASNRIDRELYPERSKRLDDELERRSKGDYGFNAFIPAEMLVAVSDQKPEPEVPSREVPLEFHGSARVYFRIWIVNLCLTLLTLGIFSAWAKVRKKRYLYSHTTLEGTPFQYLARPVPILKGRLIAAAAFLLYYASSTFLTSLLPYVLAAALVAAPWVVARSAAFNARYSSFRNMTLHFDAGYLDSLKALYPWGFIPALAMGTVLDWPGKNGGLVIGWAVFGISFPWWICRIKKFMVENTSFGGKKGDFSATGGEFFGIYFRSGLIVSGLMVPTVIYMIIFSSVLGKSPYISYFGVVLIYAAYVVGFSYVQSRSGNLVWDCIGLGPLRFRSTLRCMGLLKLYVTNALGIIATFGLLVPWAVMRTQRYRIDNLQVLEQGDLSEFHGGDKKAIAALGAEAVDIFDLDLSL
ncbi:MAG: DUF898 domain-containing protein [Deltaproteobacteria bacterium]|nr:DUF898 domain-containing protein [Deltaproteobacteria bacterium]